MLNLINKTFGERYRIIERLGAGGMASGFKAYDTRLEREVALKIILPGKQESDLFIKRFEREAKALARLTHTNIVHVIDYGEQDGILYLVMPYYSGGTLKQMLGEPLHMQ